MFRVSLAIVCSLLLVGLSAAILPAATPLAPVHAGNAHVLAELARIPLSFEPNQGQTGSQVKYFARGQGYGLYLTGTEAVLTLNAGSPGSALVNRGMTGVPRLTAASRLSFSSSHARVAPSVLRLGLVHSNPHAVVEGQQPLECKSNYFEGNDPQKWRTNIPNYGKVRYQNVYPGIDLVYYGNQGKLEI